MKSTKTFKNLVSAGVLSAVLALGYTGFRTEKPLVVPEEQILKDNKIEYTITDRLTLNMNPNKTLVTITTEAAAIEDMRYLAQKNVNEESWIQIPLRNDSRFMFVEVGKNNYNYSSNNITYIGLSVDLNLIIKLGEQIKAYRFNHYHPDKKLISSETKFIKKNPDKNSLIAQKLVKKDISGLNTDIFLNTLSRGKSYDVSLPSSADIALVRAQYLLGNNHNYVCTGNSIISSHGRSNFFITDSGKILAEKGRLKDFIGRDFDVLSSKDKLKFNGKYVNIDYTKHSFPRDTTDDSRRELLFNRYAAPYIRK